MSGTPATIGIGVIGTGSVARAHISACRALPVVYWPPEVDVRLVAVCSRRVGRARETAERWGFERATDDWRDLVADGTIDLIVNTAPNDLHAEPSIAALAAGKAVLCEKPLARSADEARPMVEAARMAEAPAATGFNYRFVPALRLARDLIQEGRLGDIQHVRGRYLKGSGADATAPLRWRHRAEVAGLGTLGDLGSHAIDLIRWLGGEVHAVSGAVRTFVPERPISGGGREAVTVDDAASAVLELAGGAIGTLDATRHAPGHRNGLDIEVNGTRGSIRFSLERLNELQVYLEGDAPDVAGFRSVLVTEPHHPFHREWWSSGHIIGWEHTFIHQARHMVLVVAGMAPLAPDAATFEDGYQVARIADAIVESAREGARVTLR